MGILRDWPGVGKRALAQRDGVRHKAQRMDPHEKRLVDQHGLAAVLDVSPAKVKALHLAGVLPAYLIDKRLRFDVEECLARLRVERSKAVPA